MTEQFNDKKGMHLLTVADYCKLFLFFEVIWQKQVIEVLLLYLLFIIIFLCSEMTFYFSSMVMKYLKYP